jgi:hypothetical protein
MCTTSIMHNGRFIPAVPVMSESPLSSLSNSLMRYSDSLTAHGARVNEGVRKRGGRHETLSISISVFGASFGYLFAALTCTIMIMVMMKSHTASHNTTLAHTQLYTSDFP